MPLPIPCVLAAIGGVCIVVGVPMALGLVGRNRYVGVRLAVALASEANWRRVNAFAGRRLALFGLFLLALGELLKDSAPPPTSAWSPLVLVVALAPLALLVRSVRRFAATLPPA